MFYGRELPRRILNLPGVEPENKDEPREHQKPGLEERAKGKRSLRKTHPPQGALSVGGDQEMASPGRLDSAAFGQRPCKEPDQYLTSIILTPFPALCNLEGVTFGRKGGDGRSGLEVL